MFLLLFISLYLFDFFLQIAINHKHTQNEWRIVKIKTPSSGIPPRGDKCNQRDKCAGAAVAVAADTANPSRCRCRRLKPCPCRCRYRQRRCYLGGRLTTFPALLTPLAAVFFTHGQPIIFSFRFLFLPFPLSLSLSLSLLSISFSLFYYFFSKFYFHSSLFHLEFCVTISFHWFPSEYDGVPPHGSSPKPRSFLLYLCFWMPFQVAAYFNSSPIPALSVSVCYDGDVSD